MGAMKTLRADLHVHTTVSDGAVEPLEALRLAAERGLGALALTDHDTDAAHAALRAEGDSLPLALIPGVELDTRLRGMAVEILVYGHRVGEGPLARMLSGIGARRRRRAEIIWQSVRRGLGAELPPLSVLYPSPRAVVTRPQMAECLFASGLAPHLEGALEMVAAYDPGFAPPETPEAMAAAQASGGLCVLAHPLQLAGGDLPALLRELAGWGLAGVEVDYPYADPGAVSRIEEVRSLAGESGLFATGGSDSHLPEEIGRLSVELPAPLRRFASSG